MAAIGSVAVADMNGDGLLDLVVAHGGWQSLGTLIQQPDGTFTTGTRPELRGAVATRNPDGTAQLRFKDGTRVSFDSIKGGLWALRTREPQPRWGVVERASRVRD